MMMNDSHRALLRSYGVLVARVLLGATFFFSGIGILLGGAAGISGVGQMISGVLPLGGLLAYLIVAVKVLGGGALMVGYRTGLAAFSLLLFTLAATVFFHLQASPSGIMGIDTGMWKNLSIIGGLLYAMAYGPGEAWSLSR